ncbi:hypothetical protein H8699_04775 [Christensenellaceae bacterium NSJ-44]|uniref:PH domain-containing protein n=1 Tax=Luoshenia tenuis TaxID=2763654 RepID=A0A926HIG3_9FIRM|nr:hypothetical protein [Luoshenia tenuis]MBC8528752.1 hypothetical protein [Luoshenia tenuis]
MSARHYTVEAHPKKLGTLKGIGVTLLLAGMVLLISFLTYVLAAAAPQLGPWPSYVAIALVILLGIFIGRRRMGYYTYELYGEKLTIYRTMGKKTTALLTLPVSAITGIGAKAKVNGRGQYFCYEKGNGFHLSYRAEKGEGWFYFQPDARMVKMLQDVRAGRKTPDADVEDD